MAWYDEARFYHIYPLGMLDAPKQNAYAEPVHRLRELSTWIPHIKNIGCNAIYIGPLFESVGHGYETTDYKKLDSRLGDNDDLKNFVKECHDKGVRVIFDGVFNHTGRDFFAFKDLKQNRESSQYKDWFCNVNFHGNNEYNDGFSYENWGGYNLLVKLNQRNPAVKDYIADVIRFWVKEFDVDGIRLDAADVLDFDFMKHLRAIANEVKPEFWLMGEVIHGDYNRWVNEGTLHSVTNYQLHKALYSGHNDHNYFEIAHTVTRLYDMGGRRVDGLKLYNFVDNHDVERLYTKIFNKEHFIPIHVLTYTLPGVPSLYYGSEFAIEGRKEKGSDDSLRPALKYEDYKDAINTNKFTAAIAKLGDARSRIPALSYGEYNQMILTNRQYVFNRVYQGMSVIVGVNNDDNDYSVNVAASPVANYVSVMTGQKVPVNNGHIYINIKANSGDIWVPDDKNCFLESVDEVIETVQENTSDEKVVSEPAEDVNDLLASVLSDVREQKGESEPKPAEDVNDLLASVLSDVREQKGESAPEPKDDVNALLASVLGDVREQKKECESKATVERIEKVLTDVEEQKAKRVSNSDKAIARIVQNTKNELAAAGVEFITDETPDDKLLRSSSEDSVKAEEDVISMQAVEEYTIGFEKGRVAGLQEAVLALMSKNGPITEQMEKDVYGQTHIPSLINWVKSFN